MPYSLAGILEANFQERKRANARYSLRAYARDLAMAPSSLSEVLSGKKGISSGKARTIAKKLRLPDWLARCFEDLASTGLCRSEPAPQKSTEEPRTSASGGVSAAISEATFRALTSWIDLAILELTTDPFFEPNFSWIAGRLGVSGNAVAESFARLKCAGFLEETPEGKWLDSIPYLSTSDGIPSGHIRRFHSELLKKAQSALQEDDISRRVMKSVVFSLSASDISEARAILDDSIRRIVALSEKQAVSQETREVLSFSTQLIALTKPRREKP